MLLVSFNRHTKWIYCNRLCAVFVGFRILHFVGVLHRNKLYCLFYKSGNRLYLYLVKTSPLIHCLFLYHVFNIILFLTWFSQSFVISPHPYTLKIYSLWHDMTWHDMIWYDIWYDMIWYDMIWYDMMWYMIWHDMTWHDMLCYVMLCYVMLCYVMLCYVMLCYVMLCYVMLCYDMIWYDMIWYDMIWYDMIWYDMIWYDMIWYDIWYIFNCNWVDTRWQ